LQIKSLTAKINNKINITISNEIDITSYKDRLSTPHDTKKLTERLYIFVKYFYKHL